MELTYCEEIYQFELPEEKEETEVQFSVADITSAMEKLPEGSRMVFSLYLLEGYDHVEISQILKITESTSKSQFMRAKRRIIELLKEQKTGRYEK